MNHWPLSNLVLETRRLRLRWPTSSDIDALADCAVHGLHEPGHYMPFWTAGPPEEVARSVVQRVWQASGWWRPDDWTLYLAVLHEDAVVGCQTLGAADFAAVREGVVTAWFDARHQGRGYGTESRAAVLELAFTGLGASDVVSVVRQDNPRSLAVARRLGFSSDGVQHNAFGGRRVTCERLRLTRERWEATSRDAVSISGLDASRELFGIGAQAAEAPGSTGASFAAELAGVEHPTECDETLD